jgi:hypothetical protein
MEHFPLLRISLSVNTLRDICESITGTIHTICMGFLPGSSLVSLSKSLLGLKSCIRYNED